jgi:hypothetical protein
MKIVKKTFKTSVLAAVFTGVFAHESNADILFSSDFIISGGIADGTQYQSGNTLEYNASVAGWTSSGFHAAHAVQITDDNWALMIF